MGQNLKENVLWGNIAWSEIGKQHIHAKKVYRWFVFINRWFVPIHLLLKARVELVQAG